MPRESKSDREARRLEYVRYQVGEMRRIAGGAFGCTVREWRVLAGDHGLQCIRIDDASDDFTAALCGDQIFYNGSASAELKVLMLAHEILEARCRRDIPSLFDDVNDVVGFRGAGPGDGKDARHVAAETGTELIRAELGFPPFATSFTFADRAYIWRKRWEIKYSQPRQEIEPADDPFLDTCV